MSVNQELVSLRTNLIELHRFLLLSLKAEREASLGRVMNPSEWFQVLLGDPDLSWIKPVNSLLSDIDALSEHLTLTPLDLSIVRFEIDRFFFKDDDVVTSFNFHYQKHLKTDHDLIVLHGRLKELVAKLPLLAELPPNVDEIRKAWHKIGASKRQRLN